MLDVPSFADLNLELTLPALFLAVFTTCLLVIDLYLPKKITTARLTLGALGVSFLINLFTFDSGETAISGMFVADPFTGFMNIIILTTAVIGVLLSVDYLKRTGMERGEYYSLLLFSTAGMMFMASANDLIVIFVSLELLSIPLYVMSAFRPNDVKSEESGLKYFILGAFASAFFVYGAALIYGATGTTYLPAIAEQMTTINGLDNSVFYMLVGTALIIVGLGFKVAVVPFHMWTPDVYDGAPTPVTAFMSVGAKVGGFAALFRIMVVALPAFIINEGDAATAWQTTAWVIAAATLILGNFVAISQVNVKRMFAYSSIAHAGYIMMAVAAAGANNGELADRAVQAALIYLLAYAFTNLGAFGIAMALEKDDGTPVMLDDFIGLAKSKPILAMMMAVFMFSLTGIPLTGGFIGKWLVFSATIEADLIPLAIIGVLTSVISAFYYVRIIVNMYLKGDEEEVEGNAAEGATPLVTWAVYASFAGTVLLGIFPTLATNLTDMVSIASTVTIP